ncbi:MAG: hypothetical protein GMKNLPBB_01342 [Myxococcota bacterium]|nr:hypothetical protein [Myxococcota bacterium]
MYNRDHDTPVSPASLLQAEMEPGEHLLWWGQPDPKRASRKGWWLWLFFAPWTLFSLFWEGAAIYAVTQAAETEMGWFVIIFPVFGVPFVLTGLYMLATPWRAYREAERTWHAVTSKRVITLVDGRERKILSLDRGAIRNIHRIERSPTDGDILFETTDMPVVGGFPPGLAFAAKGAANGFLGIREPRQVERLLRRAETPSS